uniref:Bestrophin homolog n=1 Tax=Plectus sambesii TaxID=2011161 RepID=A0A914VY79_9BILA
MTVTYTLDVATSKFSSFTRLLLRWRGSLWKAVYPELSLWLILYFVLSAVYRFALNADQKLVFENVTYFCYKYTDFIPLTFILGFFVSLVVQRWWDMFQNIGWVDNAALYIAAYIEGTDDTTRMIRRNIVRFMVLVQAMVFRDISVPIRRRFPTMETLQAAGFMSEVERKILTDLAVPSAKYSMPIQWAMALIVDARKNGRIANDYAVHDLFDRLREYRSNLGKLTCYDWVPVPLLYTQVVFLTVRAYFLTCIMGRQYVQDSHHSDLNSPIDLYIPFLTILQFVFYIGWMKVAEALVNPMGDDDDDFEVNWLLDRNLRVGLSVVDNVANKRPPLEKDVFWADANPAPLYSAQAVNTVINPYVGSATVMPVRRENDVVMMQRSKEEGSEGGDKEGTARPPIIVRGVSSVSQQQQRSPPGNFSAIRLRLSRLSSQVSGHLSRRMSGSSAAMENGQLPTSPLMNFDALSMAASSTNSIIRELVEMNDNVRDRAAFDYVPKAKSPTVGREGGASNSLAAPVPRSRRLSSDKQLTPTPARSDLFAVAEEDDDAFVAQQQNTIVKKQK